MNEEIHLVFAAGWILFLILGAGIMKRDQPLYYYAKFFKWIASKWRSSPDLYYDAEWDTWFRRSDQQNDTTFVAPRVGNNVVMDASDVNLPQGISPEALFPHIPGSQELPTINVRAIDAEAMSNTLSGQAENFRRAVRDLGGVTMQEAGESLRRFGEAMNNLGVGLKEEEMTPHERNWQIIMNSPHHYDSWGLECPVVLIRKKPPSPGEPGEYQAWCIAVYPMTHLKTWFINDPASHSAMMRQLSDWNYINDECPCKEELEAMENLPQFKSLKRKLDI